MDYGTSLYDCGIEELKLNGISIRLIDPVDDRTGKRTAASGGTCLVYQAEKKELLGEKEIVQRILLKEFYPRLNDKDAIYIERKPSGELFIQEHAEESREYNSKKERFEYSYEMFREFRNDESTNNYMVTALNRLHANGTQYILMDFDHGMILDKYVKMKQERKELSLQEIFRIVHAVAHAMSRIHGKNFLHLDLSPGNILWFEDGYVKIIDTDSFLPKQMFLNEPEKVVLSASEGYTSPQILNIMREYDRVSMKRLEKNGERADIFSLGCILFQFLTERTPDLLIDGIKSKKYDYEERLKQEIFDQYGYCTPDCAGLILKLLRKMIAYLPSERCGNMNEVLEGLDSILLALGDVPGNLYRIYENQNANTEKIIEKMAKESANINDQIEKQTNRMIASFEQFIQNMIEDKKKNHVSKDEKTDKKDDFGVIYEIIQIVIPLVLLGMFIFIYTGISSAQYEKGLSYEESGYYAEAIKYFHKSIKKGNHRAEYELAVCYEKGKGVEQNSDEALRWYRKSAEDGYSKAQYYLGRCYYTGQGAAKDYAEAVEWYRKSAEQGDANAQYALGRCYHNGEGVERNIDEAVEWYRKSAEQGNQDAKNRLTELGKIAIIN